MARVKKNKTELQAQRRALERYQRFLPTLELKKQLLRREVAHRESELAELRGKKAHLEEALQEWVRLFADPGWNPRDFVHPGPTQTDTENIAGVEVPVFRELPLEREEIDLFETPPWIDDAVDLLGRLWQLRAREAILTEARDLLAEEFRVTNQRVNLFDKVKIPEAKENIRIIKVDLGDNQIAAVARAKIAKQKIAHMEGATG